MRSTAETDVQEGAKATWAVAVIYEDGPARERAVGFCDQLVGRFWSSFEFNLGWWSFDLLRAPKSARQATEAATAADLIVVSAAPVGDLPLHVTSWLETWVCQRGAREGMLICLAEATAGIQLPESPKHRHLRNAAHRGGMDYLTSLPAELSRAIPDSIDSYASRAGQVTSLLDHILRRQPPPPTPLL